MIAVYEDYIHNKGVLLRRLARDYRSGAVRLVDARDIRDGLLQHTPPELLIVPGGADLYFCEKLNGQGNAAIRAYIENGGAYLGICAGAYYGCFYVDWAGDEPDQAIQGRRELGLINAVARGPVRKFLQESDLEASWQAATQLETNLDSPDTVTVLYEGGPVFECDDPEAEILARYSQLEKRPPAIIAKQFGKGYAVLSSPHIEAVGNAAGRSLYRHGNTRAYSHEKQVAADLDTAADNQYTLWRRIIKLCNQGGRRTGHAA